MRCGNKDLPHNFTFNPKEEFSGNVTLCGNPQPKILWMVADESFNGSVVQSNAGQHQYMYSFRKEIDLEMC